MKKIAVVCAQGIGDALIYMVLSHNFFLSGYEVVTYSNHLCGLKKWFPHHHIRPFPSLKDLEQEFAPYHRIIASDHSFLAHTPVSFPIDFIKEKELNRKITYVENLSILATERYGLPSGTKHNGFTPLDHLKKRYNQKRIIIHPSSTEERRNWPKEKFLKVIYSLVDKQFLPAICLSKDERGTWEEVLYSTSGIEFPLFATLDDLASYIYESGFLIGNNSGLGHLASCCGVPTLSLFAKNSYAALWRPGWNQGFIVTPLRLPIGGRWRQKLWKKLLTPKRVIKHFHHMEKSTLAHHFSKL